MVRIPNSALRFDSHTLRPLFPHTLSLAPRTPENDVVSLVRAVEFAAGIADQGSDRAEYREGRRRDRTQSLKKLA